MTLPSEVSTDASAMHSRITRFWTFEPFAGLFVCSSVHRPPKISTDAPAMHSRVSRLQPQLFITNAGQHKHSWQAKLACFIIGTHCLMQHSTRPGNCSLTCLRLRHCQSNETLGSMHENILFRQRQALKLSVPSSAERPAGGF